MNESIQLLEGKYPIICIAKDAKFEGYFTKLTIHRSFTLFLGSLVQCVLTLVFSLRDASSLLLCHLQVQFMINSLEARTK
jgi:hypothetical protein